MLYYYTPSKGQKDCEFVKNSNSFGVFSHPLLVSGHSCFALNSPVEGSLIISSNSSPSSSTFFAFWPNSISFGSQNDTFVFWGVLWSKWLRLPKGSLECSPNSSLLRFFGQMAVAPQKFFGGFRRQLCFTFISQSPPAVNVVWIVELTCLTQSAENDPSCRCCWGILWAYLDDSMVR